MLITAEQVLAMKPCSEYTEEIIRANHGEHGITPREIAELDIPIGDRVWVVGQLVPVNVWAEIQRLYTDFSEELQALLKYIEEQDST
ncbi:hypothetical protein LCGC14_1089040 [marine sediment metagenome]|uniref:Uncharacterized protein n=1 Tax=marine sediment metagenome TaxID=412755 RepID=A0A0F9MD74_9ZZZZ